VAAERRELYRFSTDMGKLALSIADKHGSTGEKWYHLSSALVFLLYISTTVVLWFSSVPWFLVTIPCIFAAISLG